MRTVHVRASVLVVMAVGGLLTACGDDTGPSDTTVSTSAVPSTTVVVADPLDGTTWVLDTSSLSIAGAESVVSTIRFDHGTAAGNGGCNQFSGPYVVDGSRLTFGSIQQTAMACPGPRMEVENATLPTLAVIASFVQDGGTLELRDAAGNTRLTYRSDRASLVGTWAVKGFAGDSGYAAPIDGTSLTVSFSADGTVSGSSGCNTFTGRYTLDGLLAITALGSTKKACPAPGVMEQEAAFLTALQSASSFRGTTEGVALTNDLDGLLVSLAPA